MLLFLTRDARFKFSIDDRFAAGDGEESRFSNGFRFSMLRRPGERFCQYDRGELGAKGEDSNGDESPPSIVFVRMLVAVEF